MESGNGGVLYDVFIKALTTRRWRRRERIMGTLIQMTSEGSVRTVAWHGRQSGNQAAIRKGMARLVMHRAEWFRWQLSRRFVGLQTVAQTGPCPYGMRGGVSRVRSLLQTR